MKGKGSKGEHLKGKGYKGEAWKGKSGKAEYWKGKGDPYKGYAGKGDEAWKGKAAKGDTYWGYPGKGDESWKGGWGKGEGHKGSPAKLTPSSPKPPVPSAPSADLATGSVSQRKPATESAQTASKAPDPENEGRCKYFGSAKGCTIENCPFLHDKPNSVPPCTHKQKGSCMRGDACPFRHVPWASAEQAVKHYASRDGKAVETAELRYNEMHGQLNRTTAPAPEPDGDEERREAQIGTYGKAAVKMMEKMGYVPGQGLGKKNEGGACLASVVLDPAASVSRGGGVGFETSPWTAAMKAAASATLADNRSAKKRRLADSAFVVHKLLSDDEDSDEEAASAKGGQNKLPTGIEIVRAVDLASA